MPTRRWRVLLVVAFAVALLVPAGPVDAQAPIFSGASPAPEGFVAPGVWAGSDLEILQPRVLAIDVGALIDQLLGGPEAAREQLNSGAASLTGVAVDVEIYPGFVQRIEPVEVTGYSSTFEVPLSFGWIGRADLDGVTLSGLFSITQMREAPPRLIADFMWDSWRLIVWPMNESDPTDYAVMLFDQNGDAENWHPPTTTTTTVPAPTTVEVAPVRVTPSFTG